MTLRQLSAERRARARGWRCCLRLPARRAAGARSHARSRRPGKTPVLRVPAWTTRQLANGAELVVSEKHDLPLVSFSITFLGGADQFETAGQARPRRR